MADLEDLFMNEEPQEWKEYLEEIRMLTSSLGRNLSELDTLNLLYEEQDRNLKNAYEELKEFLKNNPIDLSTPNQNDYEGDA
jgi:molecular chaperone DnaK (HSP70)